MKPVYWFSVLCLAGGWALNAALSAATPAASSAPASSTPAKMVTPKAIMGSRVIDWKTLAVKPTANGERRDVFDAPTATLLQLECHITTLLPGKTAHAPHRHPHEEIILVKEGTLEVILNGETSQVGPGSILFYAPNDLHGVKNVGETNATYHVFTWKTRETQPPAPTSAAPAKAP